MRDTAVIKRDPGDIELCDRWQNPNFLKFSGSGIAVSMVPRPDLTGGYEFFESQLKIFLYPTLPPSHHLTLPPSHLQSYFTDLALKGGSSGTPSGA
jgi:hypothetical protein